MQTTPTGVANSLEDEELRCKGVHRAIVLLVTLGCSFCIRYQSLTFMSLTMISSWASLTLSL